MKSILPLMNRVVSPEDPIVIFCDGFGDHMSMQLIDYCRERGIIIILRVPHSSHLTQCEDVHNFPLLKKWIRIHVLEAASKYKHTQDGLTWEQLMPCVTKAWTLAFDKPNNHAAWRIAGMDPWNMRPYVKLLEREQHIESLKKAVPLVNDLTLNPLPSMINSSQSQQQPQQQSAQLQQQQANHSDEEEDEKDEQFLLLMEDTELVGDESAREKKLHEKIKTLQHVVRKKAVNIQVLTKEVTALSKAKKGGRKNKKVTYSFIMKEGGGAITSAASQEKARLNEAEIREEQKKAAENKALKLKTSQEKNLEMIQHFPRVLTKLKISDIKFITAPHMDKLIVKDLISLILAKKGIINSKAKKKPDLVKQAIALYATSSETTEIINVDNERSAFVCSSEIPHGKKTATFVEECYEVLSSNGIGFNDLSFVNPPFVLWLVEHFDMRMRLTDFNARGSGTARVGGYFSKIGWNVFRDSDAQQFGLSCGPVASTAAASIAACCADNGGTEWHQLLDTTDSVSMQNIRACNHYDLNRDINNTDITTDYEVSTMCERAWPDSDDTSFTVPSMPDVCSKNFLLRKVVNDMLEVYQSKNGYNTPRIIIANTDDNNGRGYHWFTVTYSIQRKVS
jgi:hypothetical protein